MPQRRGANAATWGQEMFHVRSNSIDSLMQAVFKRLLSGHRENFRVESRKGASTEILGALLELSNPRARLSRSLGRSRVFSALGELVWYLSGSNSISFIGHYINDYVDFSDDGGLTANGAYGPRLFLPHRWARGEEGDQWQRVIDTLRLRPGSRNAIVQIFSNSDAERKSNDIPCTCTIHLLVRRSRLQMHVHMRSNDAFLGLPHDIFSFTMLQEIAARELGYELGAYKHSVTSLHLYDDSEKIQPRTAAQQYLDEGLHDIIPMPAMPLGDPWPSIKELVLAEAAIRGGEPYSCEGELDSYWRDLITLLKIHSAAKGGATTVASTVYKAYILDRIARRLTPEQSMFDLFKRREAYDEGVA